VSATFFILGMIPDLAAARDSTTVPWRKKLYTAMAFGWRGTANEWRHFTKAYLYLAALATPLVLSVHSVVSWDFAMSIVPGLAHHDLRAVLRGRRHLLRPGHGDHADRSRSARSSTSRRTSRRATSTPWRSWCWSPGWSCSTRT
jgi:hypothetical protein